MSSRTILLDVDDCLIVEIDSPDRAYAAFRGGEEHRPLVVPSDACQLAARGPRGRGPYFHRPSVSKVLRELADRGTDIV